MKCTMQECIRKTDRKGQKQDIEKKREIPTQTENNEVKKLEGKILGQPFLEED